jgi:ribokinase
MNARIVVVGNLDLDIGLHLQRFPLAGKTTAVNKHTLYPGGIGVIQAYVAAKLGCEVALVAQVGGDRQALWLTHTLADWGIDTSSVIQDPQQASGLCINTINSFGHHHSVRIPGANATFTPDKLESCRPLIRSARLVLLQLALPLATVEAAARMAQEAGALVILDPDPEQLVPDTLIACVDYITPTEMQLAALTDAPIGDFTRAYAVQKADELRARGAKKVIVKMTVQGALLVSEGRQHLWRTMRNLAPDVPSAGVAFNAAFGAALAWGRQELAAGRFAMGADACSVIRKGAQPAIPTREEVDTFLKAVGHRQAKELQALCEGRIRRR